ncbi:MAG: hypothetical protein HYX79_09820 [Chloroflexi bacterium]|nr:hypothetical protein [Chloroflexota bacterium]
MWVEVKKANNKMIAETWKELFEAENVPTLIQPTSGESPVRELTPYSVYVPKDKKHIVDEILRKL